MLMHRSLTHVLILLAALLLMSCAPVRFNQKSRFSDPAMQLGANPLKAEMLGKIMTSREGAVGGFGSSVGGCGCN
ncbi:MAG: hypothetical protein ACI9WU_004981 [Myxococcota bacterium]|jgi:hypothetical protein